jgi:hypothetical protein
VRDDGGQKQPTNSLSSTVEQESPAADAAQQQQQQVQQLQQQEQHAAKPGRRVSPKVREFAPRKVIFIRRPFPEVGGIGRYRAKRPKINDSE